MIEGDVLPGSCFCHIPSRRKQKEAEASKRKKRLVVITLAFVISPLCERYLGDNMLLLVMFSDGTAKLLQEKTKILKEDWAVLREQT